MRNFLPSKSLIHIITWLLIAMGIAVFACLSYLFHSIDSLATQQFAQRVELAIQVEAEHGRDLLEEYSFWDEAYEKIASEHDASWINKNVGNYLLNKTGYDISVGMVDQEEAFLAKTSDSQHLTFNVLKPHLIEVLTIAKTLESTTKLTNAFVALDNDIYHFVAGPFVNEETEIAIEGTLLAIGKRIDPEYLMKLSKKYQLPGLKLHLDAIKTEHQRAVHSLSGKPLGYFSWRPNLPSQDINPLIIVALIVFALIVTIVMRVIIQRDQDNRAEYEEKLFIEATTDSLTGVYNRRYFMSVGEKELNICKQLKDYTFTVFALDIDYFKEVNDRYGHSTGDLALMHFTKTCLTGLRDTDVLGRIGGEEFAVALPNTNIDQAFEVANRIRTSLANTPFIVKGHTIHLTVSIGLAIQKGSENLEAVVEKADKALYVAKSTGRNRVVAGKRCS